MLETLRYRKVCYSDSQCLNVAENIDVTVSCHVDSDKSWSQTVKKYDTASVAALAIDKVGP